MGQAQMQLADPTNQHIETLMPNHTFPASAPPHERRCYSSAPSHLLLLRILSPLTTSSPLLLLRIISTIPPLLHVAVLLHINTSASPPLRHGYPFVSTASPPPNTTHRNTATHPEHLYIQNTVRHWPSVTTSTPPLQAVAAPPLLHRCPFASTASPLPTTTHRIPYNQILPHATIRKAMGFHIIAPNDKLRCRLTSMPTLPLPSEIRSPYHHRNL